MDYTISQKYPIGFFDSGVGGFSILREIKRTLPYENTIYFADTGRRRYGSKPEKLVLQYAFEIIQFLISQKSKAIVIACNTATAVALESAKDNFNLPIIGVIEPGAIAAVKLSKNKRIGLIGTEITISSMVHQKVIESLCPSVQVFPLTTPILGEFVEKGLSEKRKIQSTIQQYLSYFIDKGIDTLILGCTHYPFLKSYINQCLGKDVFLVDPAETTVIYLKNILNKKNLLNKSGINPEHTFFTSGDLNRLDTNIRQLLRLDNFTAKAHAF